MIVVAIIGIMAAVAIPNFVSARNISWKNSCIHNLRQIEGSKMLFALEFNYGSDYTPTISELMGTNVLKNNYCSFKTIPICKVKGTYYCNPIWTMPTCSYKNGHVLGEYY